MPLIVGRTYPMRKSSRKLVEIVGHDPECKDSCFKGRYVGTQTYDHWYPDGSYLGPDKLAPKDLMGVDP